jgi:hypothetical protein
MVQVLIAVKTVAHVYLISMVQVVLHVQAEIVITMVIAMTVLLEVENAFVTITHFMILIITA